MEIITIKKDTSMLVLFGLLFVIIFGLWSIKRFYSYKPTYKCRLDFLMENASLIAGFLTGLGLLLIAFFM
ncbi:hypothetical protein BV455_00291 [Parageobacillus caldoxylosilyticus]|jgi:hypothetical protein|uniref:Uncharacterized protein n=1 Tax=Saccharococcus thermophilus TaxID=29396 RepID=A0A846MF96_9BACL|nr:hypothetical protein [Saccharococcus thermophilus]QXJ37029.1 hypothetical protein BV455_00291 [Parageobacillus caldoxylosilyticus]